MKTHWFKHPLGLSERQQMASLICEEGMKAYGTYVYLIEKLMQEPDRKLQVNKLKGFVRKGISLRYLENFITNHPDLFCINGNYFYAKDSMFSPNFCEEFDENLSKVEQNQNKSQGDNSLNNSKVCAYSRARVREEKNREEKNHHQEKMKNSRFEELHDKLQALERKRQQNNGNPYRYEQRIDGRRCYMGCPLPDNAPPRPSPKAIWNEREAYWFEPTA